jgi:hypothetical protein
VSDTPYDFSALLGDTRGLASSTARAVVLREALPMEPFSSLVTAHIPEPPVLALDTPLEHAALVVVRAYLGALRAAKSKPPQWGAYTRRSPPDITKAKPYPALCSLALLFAEHKVAPAAWAAWRLEVLRFGHQKQVVAEQHTEALLADKPRDATAKPTTGTPFKPPTLPTLMSAAWLKEAPRRGWFRKDYATKGWKGKVVSTTSRDRLMTLWDALQRDLDAERELTVEGARALLAKRFPDNLLTTLIARASVEAADRQSHYNALAAAGEWLW